MLVLSKLLTSLKIPLIFLWPNRSVYMALQIHLFYMKFGGSSNSPCYPDFMTALGQGVYQEQIIKSVAWVSYFAVQIRTSKGLTDGDLGCDPKLVSTIDFSFQTTAVSDSVAKPWSQVSSLRYCRPMQNFLKEEGKKNFIYLMKTQCCRDILFSWQSPPSFLRPLQ